MAFVQVMEMRSKNFAGLQKLEQEWRAATEGKRTLRRSITARDRDDPDRYVILAFFDSYESAMENSNLAETSSFAAKFGDYTEGPIQFIDLDVVDDFS